MGLLDDILKALDRHTVWKRLQGIPDEVDALQRRISDLEEKLGGKWPADVCRFCGERTVRLHWTYPGIDAKGNVREDWLCTACEKTDRRTVKPK